MKTFTLSLSLSLSLAAAAAAVGPNYHRPGVAFPVAWKQSAPAEVLPRGDWWKAFNDPALDELEARALNANQNRAAAGIARGSYLPSVGLNSSVNRARTSETTDNKFPVAETTTYRASLDASWEIDLCGRVRRPAVAAAPLSAQRLVNNVALIKALGGGWERPASVAAN